MAFRHYCIQNVKDEIEAYSINNESLSHSSQFISVKVMKNLRSSQAQFRETLRKFRLMQNNDFLIKKKHVFKALQVNRSSIHHLSCSKAKSLEKTKPSLSTNYFEFKSKGP